MMYVLFDLKKFQQSFDVLPKSGDVVRIEPINADVLQFHWRDLCEQASYAELGAVLERNHELVIAGQRRYEVLAKHILTKFMLQCVTLSDEAPCLEKQ